MVRSVEQRSRGMSEALSVSPPVAVVQPLCQRSTGTTTDSGFRRRIITTPVDDDDGNEATSRLRDAVVRLLAAEDSFQKDVASADGHLPPLQLGHSAADTKAVSPLPLEIRVLEREVSRLMRYIELQRDRIAQDRDESEKRVSQVMGECDGLVLAFQRKADEATRRAQMAESEVQCLTGQVARLTELDTELERHRVRYNEAERGWVALLKQKEAQWLNERDALAAQTACLTASLKEVSTERDALRGRLEEQARQAQMRRNAMRDLGTQADPPVAEQAFDATCAMCTDLVSNLSIERDRCARLSDVVARLQITVKQTADAATAWQRRAESLQQAADSHQLEAATMVDRVREHFDGTVIPELRARHSEEIAVLMRELDAAHRRIASLSAHNRNLATAVAEGQPERR